MPTVRLLAITLFLAFPLVAGCQQGLNERCQVDSDCSSDLICVLPSMATAAEGGTCQLRNGTNPDASVIQDLTASTVDATADAVPPTGDLTLDMTVAPDMTMVTGMSDGGADLLVPADLISLPDRLFLD